MKKILLFLIAFIIPSFSAYAASFSDVDNTHNNYNAIEYLKENAVINGYDDGRFKPDKLVNRAEATKILVEAFKISQNASLASSFPDVAADDWFKTYVMSAKSAGLVDGYSDGNFRPEETINLAESLKILINSAGVQVSEPEYDVFIDVAKGQWYSSYAFYAREQNIVTGDKKGKIYISQEMTRADFAEIIYRMMKVLETSKPFDLALSWDEFISSYQPFKINVDKDLWQIFDSSNETVFLLADESLNQSSYLRIYPNSATVTVFLDENPGKLSSDGYFANLRSVFSGKEINEFYHNGLKSLEVIDSAERKVDWYIYLNTNKILCVYTEYGDGNLSFQFPKFISAMINSVEYSNVLGDNQDSSQQVDVVDVSDKDSILSEIYSNLLIENKGMTSLNLLPDKVIIETDTLGVGTGAVDYYYCSTWDLSFKYERNSDLILDKRDGRTTAF